MGGRTHSGTHTTQMEDLDRTKFLLSQNKTRPWMDRANKAFDQVGSSRLGLSLLVGLADPLQLKMLRDMQEAGTAPKFVASSQELSSEAARWSGGLTGAPVEGHQTNCIHFTNCKGVVKLAHTLGIPLNTPIATFKGHTEYPSHHISMMAGMVRTLSQF